MTKQYGVIGTANHGVGDKDRHGHPVPTPKKSKNPPDPLNTKTQKHFNNEAEYENAVSQSHELTDPKP